MTAMDQDRALLAATATRHVGRVPGAVTSCMTAAADELLLEYEPLPALYDFTEEETRDPLCVVLSVHARLAAGAGAASDVGTALACGRAARELAAAAAILAGRR